MCNIRTKPDAGVVLMTGLSFYTLSTDELKFELWTRLGPFQEGKGSYDGWDLIATGTVRGMGAGMYTPIPDELFTPTSIPGGGGDGGTRAFYISLEDKDLIYKIGVGEGSDAAVQEENADLEVWEGESVLGHPMPPLEESFRYRFPRAFLGSIKYDRMPCKPYSAYGKVMSLPCPAIPTASPTTTLAPSVAPTRMPVREPTSEPTVSMSPVDLPTLAPITPPPSKSPTTSAPTMSPVVPMRVNVVSLIRNTPRRSMIGREAEKFVEIMTTFLSKHTEKSMDLEGVDLWHHKPVMVDAGIFAEGSARRRTNNKKAKDAKEEDTSEEVPAVEITMILRINDSTLPESLLGNYAAIQIDENQEELLLLLKEMSVFYSYFKNMDSITSHSIDYVTDPPTLQPTVVQPEVTPLSAEDNVSADQPNIIIFVGVGVAIIWCVLTVCGLLYLTRRRAAMRRDHAMNELLRQETVNPMERNGSAKSSIRDEEDPHLGNKDAKVGAMSSE